MLRPRQQTAARGPVVASIAPTPRTTEQDPDLAAVCSQLRPLACEVGDISVIDLRACQTAPFVEPVLSSLPRVTRVRISSYRLSSSSIDASAFKHIVAFEYFMVPLDTPSDSSGLFRILQSMPNLQELTLIHVTAELQASVLPPPFSLRSYTYHIPFAPGPHWYLPVLNSSGTLRSLSLTFTVAPPADSIRAAAEIIGPSLESLALHAIRDVVAIAEVLFPRLLRLRELAIWPAVTSEAARKLMRLLGSGAPLRKLSIPMSPALAYMLRCALETGTPPALRALRELCPLAPYSKVATSDQLSMLLRVCAQRKVRLDNSRLPAE